MKRSRPQAAVFAEKSTGKSTPMDNGALEKYVRRLCLSEVEQFVARLGLEQATHMGKKALRKKIYFYVRKTLQNCFLERALPILDDSVYYNTYFPAQKWHDEVERRNFGTFYMDMANRVWGRLVSQSTRR